MFLWYTLKTIIIIIIVWIVCVMLDMFDENDNKELITSLIVRTRALLCVHDAMHTWSK